MNLHQFFLWTLFCMLLSFSVSIFSPLMPATTISQAVSLAPISPSNHFTNRHHNNVLLWLSLFQSFSPYSLDSKGLTPMACLALHSLNFHHCLWGVKGHSCSVSHLTFTHGPFLNYSPTETQLKFHRLCTKHFWLLQLPFRSDLALFIWPFMRTSCHRYMPHFLGGYKLQGHTPCTHFYTLLWDVYRVFQIYLLN